MIKLQVIGHLGRDCVVNNVNGKNVINFSVAHAYWTDRTAIAPYLKKGTQVYAEGTPDIRNYTTNDGRPGSSLSLRISTVQLLGGRGDNAGSDGGGAQQTYPNQNSYNQQPNQPPQNVSANEITEPLDDLPF
jgi:single-strand DNA-binding protein